MNITKKLMIAAGLFFQLSNLQAMTLEMQNATRTFMQNMPSGYMIQPKSLSRADAMRLSKAAGNTPEAQDLALYAIQGGANATNKQLFPNPSNANIPLLLQQKRDDRLFNRSGRQQRQVDNGQLAIDNGQLAIDNGQLAIDNGSAAGMGSGHFAQAIHSNPAMAAELQQAIAAHPELAHINAMPAGAEKRQATSAAAAHALSDAIDKMPASEQDQARHNACNIISGSQLSSSAATAYSNSNSNSNKNLGRLSNNNPKSSPKSTAKSAKMGQTAKTQYTTNNPTTTTAS